MARRMARMVKAKAQMVNSRQSLLRVRCRRKIQQRKELSRMTQILSPTDKDISSSLAKMPEFATSEEFEELCRANRDLRFELTSTGELIVMPPTGSRTGMRNANLTYQLAAWARSDGTGVCFDSSAGFALPNNARRSPDASWIKRGKWDALTDKQKEAFAPICPDFVVEIRSPSDDLATLQNKMAEYLSNGATFAWLIDPFDRRVYIYKTDAEILVLHEPEVVVGDPLLSGFRLQLAELW